MVDFQTQCRLYGYKYSTPESTKPAPSLRENYHEVTPGLFKTPRVQVHDCRPEYVQDFRDQHQWEAYLFKHGLNRTYSDINSLHHTPRQEPGRKKPDKLICSVGKRGSSNGEFHFPRGLATAANGEVLVADSKNHRIQVLSQCGIYIRHLGSDKGSKDGEFSEPTGVAIMPNGDIAVADRRNKRVQVFDPDWKFRFQFPTVDPPFHIACDDGFAIIASTTKGTVEIYRRQAKLWQRFTVGESGPCPIAVNDKMEVIVADVSINTIKFFNYTGKLLYQFQPRAVGEALTCQPTSISFNVIGQLIIADGLNHTVSLYTERGTLLEQLVGPADDAGSVQACVVGPEGHLVVTEFTGNGDHCIKIFRYRDCECHRQRPSSSKKSGSQSPLL